MNTVKIGDNFENKSYDIIIAALNSQKLGLIPDYCSVYRKKGYYSVRRKKEIIFDLSIEVKPPGADRPTLLYLIECKNYSSSIPVDDVALFAQYKSEIHDYAVKGVFVTNSKLQSGAIEEIKSHGMMLIEVDEENYNIVHYKNERKDYPQDDIDQIIIKAIQGALLPAEVEGLKKLSAKHIDAIASQLITEFRPEILNYGLPIPLPELLKHLNKKHKLKYSYSDMENEANKQVLGYFDAEKNEIILSLSIKDSVREPFVVAHEIGHFILHKNLRVNKARYNNFKDTSFSLFEQSYTLKNPKNWIEWQANCFAASLLMPQFSIQAILILTQNNLGISKAGSIFLDDQECNRRDFIEIIERMAGHFNVSKQSIEYRLNDLGLIVRPKTRKEPDAGKELLRRISILNSNHNF
ncbi:Zn-dependent peptidase ImmA (M78 family) [Flavobacterium sp. HSC-32F16]|uniref:ImmA/IrrE family metallo-endopeptidase n=1 Tax=Flavobacterium sp. HSC-32F16 TaxID=2910964 RepID=UPI0020A443B8|nr:ImmA/IrrE family metallo-endopeptidase [Flavobacterium sp. HSC-32F16]MCP2027395.1 Zn-dependent peptidase ImmA (M78 family) [Flavobacterium sp. HSC-32F16]